MESFLTQLLLSFLWSTDCCKDMDPPYFVILMHGWFCFCRLCIAKASFRDCVSCIPDFLPNHQLNLNCLEKKKKKGDQLSTYCWRCICPNCLKTIWSQEVQIKREAYTNLIDKKKKLCLEIFNCKVELTNQKSIVWGPPQLKMPRACKAVLLVLS